MAGHKLDRITADIQWQVSAILREMKDPRLNQLLSVVKVRVSGDGSYATIYVSSMKGKEAAGEAVKALKNAAGFVRSELGRRIDMRKTPELRFVADDSIEYSARINRRLEEMDETKTKPEGSSENLEESEEQ